MPTRCFAFVQTTPIGSKLSQDTTCLRQGGNADNNLPVFAEKKIVLHCKRRLSIFPSPAGMPQPNSKLDLAGKNKIIPGQGEFG
jgi:hypothetical protein